MPGLFDSISAAGELSSAVLQYGPEIGRRMGIVLLGSACAGVGVLFIVTGSKAGQTVIGLGSLAIPGAGEVKLAGTAAKVASGAGKAAKVAKGAVS